MPLCLQATQPVVRGLPRFRSYPLEEIGNATRGSRLCFDQFGRIAVISDGAVTVLNDTIWAEVAQPRGARDPSVSVLKTDSKGEAYFGGLGCWGRLSVGAGGHLKAISLVNEQVPEWVRGTIFNHIVFVGSHVCFSGWNGVVVLDADTGAQRFFQLEELTALFEQGGALYACTMRQGLFRLAVGGGMEALSERLSFPVNHVVALSGGRVLLVYADGRAAVYDGKAMREWTGLTGNGLKGVVSAVEGLGGGRLAIAVTGLGLFVLTEEGVVERAYTVPQYQRVTSLAAREAGVLWVLTEGAVQKLLYGSPMTFLGQELGISVSWPTVLRWQGGILIGSEGRLYVPATCSPTEPTRFKPAPWQLKGGAWAMVSCGGSVLVGNIESLVELHPDMQVTEVLKDFPVSFLRSTPGGLVYVVGKDQLAVLRREEGLWKECAPRVAGMGTPSVVQVVGESLWMEFGADRVGRLHLSQGRLLLEQPWDPRWKGTYWVNVGRVGSLAVLSASPAERLYFDESTGAFCEGGVVERVLAGSPHEIVRVFDDASGNLWATHRHGVVRFTPDGAGYSMDAVSFDRLTELYPQVQITEGNEVWFSGQRTLMHVEPGLLRSAQEPVPVLVGATPAGAVSLPLALGQAAVMRLAHGQGPLSLSFFSGHYNWLQPPRLLYRLGSDAEWSLLSPGAPLNLSGLGAGSHALEVRADLAAGAPCLALTLEIQPPWYRSPIALVLQALGVVLFIVLIIRWSGARGRRRNKVLERLVGERTAALEATMARLNEETRTAATLEERNRLAGEIHDSLQQGLCGAILQLDATIKHPSSQGPLRERLATVRNMISYTRHEVQSAVWDLESPVLGEAGLGDALRKLAILINPGTVELEVCVEGVPRKLPTKVEHHLLRITQEAMANAVKHSGARRIRVLLAYGDTGVLLEVLDDGAGFPLSGGDPGVGHFGLRGMQARARQIGAGLELGTAPAGGARVALHTPYDNIL